MSNILFGIAIGILFGGVSLRLDARSMIKNSVAENDPQKQVVGENLRSRAHGLMITAGMLLVYVGFLFAFIPS